MREGATELGVGRSLRATTERMAYGPHAVARVEGKVLFVRGGAPDEEVDVVVTDERRTHAYARVHAVIRPSTMRCAPPCPYLPRCGGCPWQHLDYPAQLAAKREIVAEQLRRLGGLDAAVSPVIPSPLEYGYRRRLKLRVEDAEVGFYAGASHVLVPVDHCLLAESTVDSAIPIARDLVRQLHTHVRRIEIAGIGTGDSAVVLAGEAEGAWQSADEPSCRDLLLTHPIVRGLHLSGRSWRRSWGETRVTIEPEPDLPLEVTARSFTQVNALANQALVAIVLRLAEPRANLSVLELYAGAGNFSIPLARRGADLLAVEADRQAADDARRNAETLGVPYRIRVAPAHRAVGDLVRRRARFDLVLLDPPRSGAAEVMNGLLDLKPQVVVYVSCDVATLARDLRILARQYRIDAVQPVDMFPHTYHVETVVRARLAGR